MLVEQNPLHKTQNEDNTTPKATLKGTKSIKEKKRNDREKFKKHARKKLFKSRSPQGKPVPRLKDKEQRGKSSEQNETNQSSEITGKKSKASCTKLTKIQNQNIPLGQPCVKVVNVHNTKGLDGKIQHTPSKQNILSALDIKNNNVAKLSKCKLKVNRHAGLPSNIPVLKGKANTEPDVSLEIGNIRTLIIKEKNKQAVDSWTNPGVLDSNKTQKHSKKIKLKTPVYKRPPKVPKKPFPIIKTKFPVIIEKRSASDQTLVGQPSDIVSIQAATSLMVPPFIAKENTENITREVNISQVIATENTESMPRKVNISQVIATENNESITREVKISHVSATENTENNFGEVKITQVNTESNTEEVKVSQVYATENTEIIPGEMKISQVSATENTESITKEMKGTQESLSAKHDDSSSNMITEVKFYGTEKSFRLLTNKTNDNKTSTAVVELSTTYAGGPVLKTNPYINKTIADLRSNKTFSSAPFLLLGKAKADKKPVGESTDPLLQLGKVKADEEAVEECISPFLSLGKVKADNEPVEECITPFLSLGKAKADKKPVRESASPFLPLGKVKADKKPVEEWSSPFLSLGMVKTDKKPVEECISTFLPLSKVKAYKKPVEECIGCTDVRITNRQPTLPGLLTTVAFEESSRNIELLCHGYLNRPEHHVNHTEHDVEERVKRVTQESRNVHKHDEIVMKTTNNNEDPQDLLHISCTETNAGNDYDSTGGESNAAQTSSLTVLFEAGPRAVNSSTDIPRTRLLQIDDGDHVQFFFPRWLIGLLNAADASGAGDVTELDPVQADDGIVGESVLSPSYNVRVDEDAGGDLTAFSVRPIRHTIFSLDETNGDVMDPGQLSDNGEPEVLNNREVADNPELLNIREHLNDTELVAFEVDILQGILNMIGETSVHVEIVENDLNHNELKELDIRNKPTVDEAGTSGVHNLACKYNQLSEQSVDHLKQIEKTNEDSVVHCSIEKNAKYQDKVLSLIENGPEELENKKTERHSNMIKKHSTEITLEHNIKTKDIINVSVYEMPHVMKAESDINNVGNLNSADFKRRCLTNCMSVDNKSDPALVSQKDRIHSEQISIRNANNQVYTNIESTHTEQVSSNDYHNSKDISISDTPNSDDNNSKRTNSFANVTDSAKNKNAIDINFKKYIDEIFTIPEVETESNDFNPNSSNESHLESPEALLTKHRSVAAQTIEPEYVANIDSPTKLTKERKTAANSIMNDKSNIKQHTKNSKSFVQPVVGKRPTLRNINTTPRESMTNAFGKVYKSAASTDILKKRRTKSREFSPSSDKPRRVCHYMRNYVQLIVKDATKE